MSLRGQDPPHFIFSESTAIPSTRQATGRTYFISLAIGLTVAVLCFWADWQTSGNPGGCQKSPYYRITRIFSMVERAIENWRKTHGGLPDSLDLLVDSDDLKKEVFWLNDEGRVSDVWLNPLIYKIEGDDYELISYGQDGQPGGVWFDSDVSNRGPFPPESFQPSLKMFWESDYAFFPIITSVLAGFFSFVCGLVLLREQVLPTDLPEEERSVFAKRKVASTVARLIALTVIVVYAMSQAVLLGIASFSTDFH